MIKKIHDKPAGYRYVYELKFILFFSDFNTTTTYQGQVSVQNTNNRIYPLPSLNEGDSSDRKRPDRVQQVCTTNSCHVTWRRRRRCPSIYGGYKSRKLRAIRPCLTCGRKKNKTKQKIYVYIKKKKNVYI